MRRELERQAARSARWSSGFWTLFFAALVLYQLGPQLLGVGADTEALVARVMEGAGLAAANCLFVAMALRAFGRAQARKAWAPQATDDRRFVR